MQSPDILGEKLLIVARQLVIAEVGRLDLLAMDSNGKLVIIELKRSMAPREAVAQALDYASWLNSVSEDEILGYANQYLQGQSDDAERSLGEAFLDTFGSKLPEWIPQNHRVLLVAAGLDASAERIVNYLAQKRLVEINAIFFNYCELSDHKQILLRSVLVPESTIAPPKPGDEDEFTEPVLLAMANERHVTELVKTCRQMRDVWEEQPRRTGQRSFRYWTGGRMVYGINVSGKLTRPNTPIGELDIWVRPDTLAEVTAISEADIKQRLSKEFTPFDAGRMDFVIRLKTPREAEKLISVLRGIASEQAKKTATAAHVA